MIVENKSGRLGIRAKAFVDATGDADLCFLAGEATASLATNVRTGWYFSGGSAGVRLHQLTDPIHGPIPATSRRYAGDRHWTLPSTRSMGAK